MNFSQSSLSDSRPSPASARSNTTLTPQPSLASRNWGQNFWLDALGVFLVLFLFAAEPIPAVNEPHYWTKAKHFWDSSYAPGDIFIDSGNAHWLFYASFGLLTKIVPLPTAVWIARFILWGSLALGWTWMMHGFWGNPRDPHSALRTEIQLPSHPKIGLIATFSATLWLAGMSWGHLAGEWVAGGAEAKVAAYALIFFAFGFFFREHRTIAWMCLGGACAFHVVTGIWVMLGSICVSAALEARDGRPKNSWSTIAIDWWLKHGWGILLSTAGLVVGVVPAVIIDWGTPTVVTTQAALIQVYSRLGHHLAPSMFTAARWQAFLILFGITVILAASGGLLGFFKISRFLPSFNSPPNRTNATARKLPVTKNQLLDRRPIGLKWILGHALFAISIASIACAIDFGGGGLSREVVAKILKYYWFRWNDVAMPMAAMALAIWLATSITSATGKRIAFLSLIAVGSALVLQQVAWHRQEWVGSGEKARLLNRSDSREEQEAELRDWLAVCQFIREKTEPGELWLTPRNQQTFKWHTGRAEVAAWKDMPQDAASVVEWARRLNEVYPTDSDRKLQPWSTEKISELHQHYRFRYVLIDRRIRGQSPPLLPLLYPQSDDENATFSVFEMPNF